MLTSENYFKTIELGGIPVLSHSLLKHGMPMNGGNQYRLEQAYDKLVVHEETKALALGSLLHKYVEDPDQFILQPDWDHVSDTIMAVGEYVWRSTESPADMLISHEGLIRSGAQELNYGQSWKPETLVTKVIAALGPWWQFKLAAKGKIPLFGNTLDKMSMMIESLKKSEMFVPVLQADDRGTTYRELAVQWSIDNLEVKSMLDIVEVDDVLGLITVTDLKTMSYPVSQFADKYTYGWSESQKKVVRIPMASSVAKYNYFTQEYLYRLAAKAWAKQNDLEDYDISFHFAAIETVAPFQCSHVVLSNTWMDTAEKEINAALAEATYWFERKGYWKF